MFSGARAPFCDECEQLFEKFVAKTQANVAVNVLNCAHFMWFYVLFLERKNQRLCERDRACVLNLKKGCELKLLVKWSDYV